MFRLPVVASSLWCPVYSHFVVVVVVVVPSMLRRWFRMAHGFVISWFGIISFVLYDYYPLGVSFLFYFANPTYNYRAALPIKRAKGGKKTSNNHNRNVHAPTTQYLLGTNYEFEKKKKMKKYTHSHTKITEEKKHHTVHFSCCFRVLCRRWNSLQFFFLGFSNYRKTAWFSVHVWLLLWVLFYIYVKHAEMTSCWKWDLCKFGVIDRNTAWLIPHHPTHNQNKLELPVNL